MQATCRFIFAAANLVARSARRISKRAHGRRIKGASTGPTSQRIGRALSAVLLISVKAYASPVSTVPTASGGHIDYYAFHGAQPDLLNPPPPAYAFQVYVPPEYTAETAWPMLVVLHGCGTTADQMMYSSLMNDVADSNKFLVVYPDNGGGCWRGVSEDSNNIDRGGGGDADQVAGMTQQAMTLYSVDTERVYLVGMSSGAFQATATAAAYPDIYAAAGVHSGGPFGSGLPCIALGDVGAPIFALEAINQMGSLARIVPFISFGGTTDPLGEDSVGGCARQAFYAAMDQNNAITAGFPGLFSSSPVGGLFGGPYVLDPSSTANGQVPGGYAWTKKVWRDRSNCEIGEEWIVTGMGHYWSGGSTDPKYWGTQPNGQMGFNDPNGPSASNAMWTFLSRYRKSETGRECAEASTDPPPFRH